MHSTHCTSNHRAVAKQLHCTTPPASKKYDAIHLCYAPMLTSDIYVQDSSGNSDSFYKARSNDAGFRASVFANPMVSSGHTGNVSETEGHTHAYAHTHTQIHQYRHVRIRTAILHRRTLHAHSHSHKTPTQTRIPTIKRMHKHTHTHIHSRKYTCTHTHTHAHAHTSMH